MKKLIFIAIAVLGLTFTTQAQEVAHFSIDTLFNNLPSYAKAMDLIKAKSVEEEDKLVLQRKRIEELTAAYQKEITELPPAIKQIKEEEIQKEYQKMQEMQYEAQASVEQYQAVLNQEILLRIKKATKTIAEKMGIKYVVEEQATVYAGGKNITQEVLAETLRLEKEATSGTK